LDNLQSGNGLFSKFHQQWFHYTWKNFDIQHHLTLSTETEFWFYHPVSMYNVAAYGFHSGSLPVDLKEINFNAEHFNRFSYGFTKKVNDYFTYGFNFHFYNATANISSSGNQGKIYTVKTGDYYTTYFENINLKIRTGGLRSFIEQDSIGYPSVDPVSAKQRLIRKLIWGNNPGLGFDFGMQKKINQNWTFTFNISDLGFILYVSDVYVYKAAGSFDYEGINVEFPSTPIDYWKNVKKELGSNIPETYHKNAYIKLRSFKTYISFKRHYGSPLRKIEKRLPCYDETKDLFSGTRLPYFGIMGFAQNLQGKPYLGTAVYWQLYPTSWFDLRLTYGFDTFIPNNLGIAAKFRIWKWNWFLSADNLLSLKDISKSHGYEIRFGTYFIIR
jgi:hypothetical protein